MLEFKNVNVSVGRTLILEGISLSVKTGSITAVVGPNGCGKTTLLQTLNGTSKVTAGEIFLDGDDFLSLPVRERARRLSFLPQFRETAPNISVRGLAEHGRFPYLGFSRTMMEEDRKAVDSAIEFVSLKEQKRKLVSELSGGQQQRAYMAMQLAQDCPVMVLDEPMNFLDFESQREMLALVKKLKDGGKTVILVLHDLNQALTVADELVVMKDRKIESVSTPEEAVKNGVIERVFNCTVTPVDISGMVQYLLT